MNLAINFNNYKFEIIIVMLLIGIGFGIYQRYKRLVFHAE